MPPRTLLAMFTPERYLRHTAELPSLPPPSTRRSAEAASKPAEATGAGPHKRLAGDAAHDAARRVDVVGLHGSE